MNSAINALDFTFDEEILSHVVSATASSLEQTSPIPPKYVNSNQKEM